MLLTGCIGLIMAVAPPLLWAGSIVATLRPWTGEEILLDVGCGRGLMLLGAARRLTTGHAVGIDLWRDEDQAENSPEALEANARLEGVADRIRIDTGDARQLPYPNATPLESTRLL